MAADCIAVLNEVGWKKGVHCIGVSMGGMISLELVLSDLDRFVSLVLTSTHAGRTLPPVLKLIYLLTFVVQIGPSASILEEGNEGSSLPNEHTHVS